MYPGHRVLASDVDRTQDLSIGRSAYATTEPIGPANLWACGAQVLKMYLIAQAMTSPCALLEWRTQLRRICDVTRHNFKWNICDVMKQKDLKGLFKL